MITQWTNRFGVLDDDPAGVLSLPGWPSFDRPSEGEQATGVARLLIVGLIVLVAVLVGRPGAGQSPELEALLSGMSASESVPTSPMPSDTSAARPPHRESDASIYNAATYAATWCDR